MVALPEAGVGQEAEVGQGLPNRIILIHSISGSNKIFLLFTQIHCYMPVPHHLGGASKLQF